MIDVTSRRPDASREAAAPPPIRLLRLTPHFFRTGDWPVAYDPVGGSQNQIWRLTRALGALGVVQTVVTTFLPGAPRRSPLFDRARLLVSGPAVPEHLALECLNFSWFLGALAHLLAHRRRYDVAHLHLNHSLWSRLLARAVKIAGLPLVVTLNVSLLSDGPVNAAPDDEARARWPERLALAAADRIVALTRRHLETVRAQVPHRLADVRIVPDAVDAAEYALAASPQQMAAFCSRYGVPAAGTVVAYVGRIGDEKGWRDLPRIVAAMAARGVFVLVCGDGPRRKALERDLAALNLPSHWTITGFVAPETVALALQRTRVVLRRRPRRHAVRDRPPPALLLPDPGLRLRPLPPLVARHDPV